MARNPWIQFLQDHKGQRMTLLELRQRYNMYGGSHLVSQSMEVDPESTYIKGLTERIREHDFLSDQEAEQWRAAFRAKLMENDTTKESLLNQHDVWLKRIQYEGEDERMQGFYRTIVPKTHRSVEDFLSDVTDYFSLEELVSAEVL